VRANVVSPSLAEWFVTTNVAAAAAAFAVPNKEREQFSTLRGLL